MRQKYVDDLWRNRELLVAGRVVLPVVKEDLATPQGMDDLMAQAYTCAHRYFGVDMRKRLLQLENTDQKRDRHDFLRSILPHGRADGSSRGTM
ncbi:MAG: hypothetical protein Q4A01_05920 [Coriobacteriales bacterium]|nr:hypothetical protein [Coriobacteriales bacterium]